MAHYEQLSYELKPESDGKYQLKTRFAKFTNLPELMGMFKECADIRTADTLDLDKPKADVTEVVATPSKIQKKAIKALGKRATDIRNGNLIRGLTICCALRMMDVK